MTLRELLKTQNEFNEAICKLLTREDINDGTSAEDLKERKERLAKLKEEAWKKMREFKAASYMFIRNLVI